MITSISRPGSTGSPRLPHGPPSRGRSDPPPRRAPLRGRKMALKIRLRIRSYRQNLKISIMNRATKPRLGRCAPQLRAIFRSLILDRGAVHEEAGGRVHERVLDDRLCVPVGHGRALTGLGTADFCYFLRRPRTGHTHCVASGVCVRADGRHLGCSHA